MNVLPLFISTLILAVLGCFHGANATHESGTSSGEPAGNKKPNFGSFLQIFNKTGKFTKKTTTTTTPKTTTTTMMKPTPTTTKPPCVCGTGAKPKIKRSSRIGLSTEDYDVDYLQDDEGDFSFEDRNRNETESEESNNKLNTFRIIHGYASNPNGWPWMAALMKGGSLFCGGTLINSQYIVTAAHCIQRNFKQNKQAISDTSVILGTNYIGPKVKNKTVVKISEVYVNPKYSSSTGDYDIAILKLALPIRISNAIRPICLNQAGSPFNNRNMIVAGWGDTYTGSPAQKWLREAGMRTISNNRCATGTDASPTPRNICAVGVTPLAGESGPCNGDSGGPLMLWRPKTKTYTLVGIVSRGLTAVCGKSPEVFTRVSGLMNFVKSVTNGAKFCSNSF